uniref:Uncharacterized protein n=1 Tax=Anguilla anguilla TaxID=7936 RepID=A0A0E9X9Q8_ANGAN
MNMKKRFSNYICALLLMTEVTAPETLQ